MLILGEIRGQLREIIHSTNNISQSVTALGLRVSALEAKDQRREGASGVLAVVLRSPTMGWIVGGATTIWALVTGRLHL
jgi:hypothetical protein